MKPGPEGACGGNKCLKLPQGSSPFLSLLLGPALLLGGT